MAKPPTSRQFLSRSHFGFVPKPVLMHRSNQRAFDHFISSNERRLLQRHTERTAVTLGVYRLTSFAFQILHKMIASCRPGDGR